MKSPVVLFAYNRPSMTAHVIQQIIDSGPTKVFAFVDGPKHPGDGGAKIVADLVEMANWGCDVDIALSPYNKGCRRNVVDGLNTVFRNCDRAIILEDDLDIHPSFFPYVDELLDRFADDNRVWAITGLQPNITQCLHSYWIDKSLHLYGWGTWSRVWNTYDESMSRWPELRSLLPLSESQRCAFDDCFAGAMDTWDYQFLLSYLEANGLCVVPAVNLITNVGVGTSATHTKTDTGFTNIPKSAMGFPLIHPLH